MALRDNSDEFVAIITKRSDVMLRPSLQWHRTQWRPAMDRTASTFLTSN
jgi:hypothetical protein